MTGTMTQADGGGRPIRAGIAYMALGVFLMTGMDVAAKWLLDTYSLSQLVFLRCAVSMLVIGIFILIRGTGRALYTHRPGWHLLRSIMMSLATFSFFYALHLMPLANVVIIAFAAPVIVTALSGPFLGERVGVWRWSAVVVGFIGVIIVVRPAPGLIGSGALPAVFATFMWAGLSLTARKLSASESTTALSLYLFPLPMLIGAFGSIDSWVAPTGQAWLLFVICGTFGGFAFIAINAAFRWAPAAVIVPFEYTGLIWAIAAGMLIWQELPDVATLVGAAIIVSSGLVILYRETRSMAPGHVPSDFAIQDVVAAEDDR